MKSIAVAALALFVLGAAPAPAEEVEQKPVTPGAQAAVNEKAPAAETKPKTASAERLAKSTAKKNADKKKNGATGAKEPTPAPAEKAPEPVPPVTGGGAESALNLSKKPVGEPTAVTTAPLPYVVRKVSVLVESNPSGSDIEIDGVYVGSTPVELMVKEGVHSMRISKEGYLSWEKPVKAYNGLYINPALVSESTRKKETTESVKVK
ncbi:MAG: PEGA domain-containing protein [Nitrospinae bacterium]|nr:PEGA domain-containing protein [Nitrospinota bacterium]